MNLTQKAKKAVAAGLALSTLVWGTALFALPVASAAPHSNGCLVNLSGTVYLVTGGQKRGFTSAEVFMSHGYNFGQVVAGNSDDSALPTGSILIYANGTLVKGPSDPLVYLVVNGQKRGFTSGSVFTGLGYSFANIQWAPVNTFNDIPTGANIDSTAIAGLPMSGPGPQTVTCTTGTGSGGVNDGTEGSVESYALGAPDESSAREGENDVEIYSVDVTLEDDGDLQLDRVDVWFSQTATADDDPWAYFESVALLVNGSQVAEMDADSPSDWTDASNGELGTANTDNEFRMRFSGLNSVLDSGETSEVSVAVSMMNNIDSADEDAVWVVEIDDDAGFRFTDGTGFTFTDGPGAGTTLEDSFTVGGVETASIDLTVSEDSPDAKVIEVDETSDTNNVVIGIYNVEETAGVDVTVDTITVGITIVDPAGGVDPAGAGTVARTASLLVDGSVIGTETVPATADAVDLTFDNLNWDLSGDANEDVSVRVNLEDTNSAARYDNGTTIQVDAFAITVIDDENGNDESDITTLTTPGAADAHELRTSGIMLEFVSSSASKTFTADSTGEEDQGTFSITFDVTAFGTDQRVDKTCALNEDQGDAGEGLSLLITNSGDLAGDTITSCIITSGSTDTEDNANVFEVDENSTRRLTLTVIATNDGLAADFHEVSLEAVNYGTATDNTNASFYTFNLGDFKTDPLHLTFVP